MYIKVEVFVPKENEKELISALNAQGLLGTGAYDFVYAATEVMGHWRPLSGAKPYSGQKGFISEEKELKLEFRISASQRHVAEALIRRVHPYEEPVINFIELL